MKKELIIRSNNSAVDFALLNDGKLIELNKEIENNKFSKLQDFRKFLIDSKLPFDIWHRVVKNETSLIQSIRELNHNRHTFPYATDGAVIKVNETKHHDVLGHTSRFPK